MLYLTQRVDSPTTALTASVTLPIDVRVKSRIKVTLNDGRDAGLLLPRGLLLRGGDVLSNEEGSEFVEVIAADEGVSVVRCDDPFMLAKACYHLGNRHVPLQIMPGELRFHHDHVLDDMLRQFGLAVTFAQLPFEPEAGAYASESHGHSHGHDHEHHHHEHNH
ncbi:urease accessory protein UreE [Klebsiella sp. R390]|uniref:urease accessory protein UreE n=1 Tax=Klebsiella sp. R390 TaxID=2755400 RepID=UPI003DA87D20